MLYNYFISLKFTKFIQNNFFLDFFFKKITEIFLKNFIVLGGLFFLEKFIIEHITCKSFKFFILFLNFFKKFFYFFIDNMFFYFFIFFVYFCLFLEFLFFYF